MILTGEVYRKGIPSCMGWALVWGLAGAWSSEFCEVFHASLVRLWLFLQIQEQGVHRAECNVSCKMRNHPLWWTHLNPCCLLIRMDCALPHPGHPVVLLGMDLCPHLLPVPWDNTAISWVALGSPWVRLELYLGYNLCRGRNTSPHHTAQLQGPF